MSSAPTQFAVALLGWYHSHGRHDLPWQRDRDPYRVWVSEIMLQQTQVGTVIPYFDRFVARFPDVVSLAAASDDDVLHLWSGLGYYARARNLQHAARLVRDRWGGQLPRRIADLQQLPGIGRSTAGAILALAHGQRHAILDGNARRVLCRYYAIEGFPGVRAVEQRLWRLAARNTPVQAVAAYTQAIMDLGATVCRRAAPRCGDCPVARRCVARRRGIAVSLPAPRPLKALPVRAVALLLIRDDRGRILLEKRPPAGVWGGLWSPPECEPAADVCSACAERLGLVVQVEHRLASFRHTFSHYHLDVEQVLLSLRGAVSTVMETPDMVWYNPDSSHRYGLAAPVKSLLNRLCESR